MNVRGPWKWMILMAAAVIGMAFQPGCSRRKTRLERSGVDCLSIVPTIGLTTGGTNVAIAGMHFQPGAVVRFGQADATGVTVSGTGQEITCQTSAGSPGFVDVVVWNPDRIGCRIVDGFEYVLPPSPPRIASVSYVDANANCLVDSGDTLAVTFTANVTFTVADPNQAFQLPVTGDSFGAGARFPGGTPSDTGTAIVELGATPVLSVAGTFDPGVPLPGSPSGLDVGAAPGAIVDAVFPQVSAIPYSPPGLDIEGPGPIWTSVGEDQEGAWFGTSAVSAGDVNNDGFSDILVGAPGYDTLNENAGKIYLYLGGPTGPGTTPGWTSIGEDEENTYFGGILGPAGDVNGDGFDDVIIGVPYMDSTTWTQAGKAYVYLGEAGGLSATPAWTSSGDDEPFAWFGEAVATTGDVNGDGFSDVIVGAPYIQYGPNVGKAFVYLGGAGGLSSTPVWISIGESQAGAHFGESVGSAGDVNNDGFGDVIVGAHDFNTSNPGAGRAYVYLGGPLGVSTTAIWISSGEDFDDAFFGSSVRTAGDVNNDGYSDLIIGAYNFGGDERGRAYLYLGGSGGVSSSPVWMSSGENLSYTRYGSAVGSAGDLNNDGYSEVFVGSPQFGPPLWGTGKVYVYLGGPAGLSPSPVWTSLGENQEDAFFGESVSAGDVNGDGLPEIIVGADGYDTSNRNAGKAYVYCVRP